MVSHVISLLAALPLNSNTKREMHKPEKKNDLGKGSDVLVLLEGWDKRHIQILTKMMDLDGGNLADVSLDEKIYVGEDNKWRSQRRTGMVLNNQVVALELPINVTVCLHLRKGVTGQTKTRLSAHVFEKDGLAERTIWFSYLNMAMSRLIRRMLVTSR